MIAYRRVWTRIRPATTVAWLAAAFLAFAALASPHSARADTVTFGSTLNNVPTLDTANGDYSNTGSTTGPENAVGPNPHSAEDTAIWNVSQSAGSPVAAASGQVLQVKVEGCAVEDNTAPVQESQNVPVNLVVFQSLQPDSAGGYTATSTYGADGSGTGFLIPFCSNSKNPSAGAVSTSTVTTYTPFRACVSQGEVVGLHDIGGFVPTPDGSNAGPWYPQGIPLDVIAQVKGSSMQSYVGINTAMDPNDGSGAAAGWAAESGQEVEIQIVEGTGNDAWSSCPGGRGLRARHRQHDRL